MKRKKRGWTRKRAMAVKWRINCTPHYEWPEFSSFRSPLWFPKYLGLLTGREDIRGLRLRGLL